MASGTKSKGGRPSKAKLAIGKTFGMLSVHEMAPSTHGGGTSNLRCLCSCGKGVVVTWVYLNQSKNPNCGCTPWRPLHRIVSKEHRAAVDAKWRAENQGRIHAKQKEWRDARKADLAKRRASWRIQNPEKVAIIRRRFKEAHPERVAADKAKRRAVKRGATVGDTRVIARWEGAWRAKRRVRCYWCGGMFPPSECQSDHILALAGGGAHEVGNLCVACGPCNGRKNAKSVAVWNWSLSQPVLL